MSKNQSSALFFYICLFVETLSFSGNCFFFVFVSDAIVCDFLISVGIVLFISYCQRSTWLLHLMCDCVSMTLDTFYLITPFLCDWHRWTTISLALTNKLSKMLTLRNLLLLTDC